MPQNKEAEAFLERIKTLPSGPGVSLDEALKPSIEDETELRQYFASDRGNARLADPYVGLVDVFAAPIDIRTTRARVVKEDEDGADLIAKHIMPVPKEARRPEGAPCVVEDLDEFKKNWSIFTEGSLSQLFDWNNVVAAGGAVLACLTPLADENKVSKRAIRKHYHGAAYPTSDVDLFLWGMTPEQAEAKIVSIYEAVRDSVPWDVTCIRTRHTVSIHSQYPYRSVQIVLRLYQSPAEILAGFDIDSPCCAYDGTRVWANPRAIVAMMRQANTVDMTRRSPSYEVRLTKYANRGFEVYVPDLDRAKIDPTIYERAINKMEGLARLLVFEKLMDGDARYAFLESRRKLRGRPNPLSRYRRDNNRKYKGDLKEEKAIGGLEMNDYDVASLHIPYGPGWDARRIDKLVYQTDLGMNSTFNPKNNGRRLHRHPAFFGTMQECLEDCCESCPEPIDDDEKALIAEEDDQYIIGRIKFIEENPGRQTMTGSFNPIDVGEWSEQVYVKETEKFFGAIARNDVESVKEHIKAEIDLNHRDHVGRTCLHVAILSNAKEVALELIQAGARITARLVDGRSALHLAARYDQLEVIKKLLEKSAANEAEAKKDEEGKEDAMDEDKKPNPERPSSDDDWSSHDEDGKDIEMKDTDADDEDDDEDGEEDEGEEDEDEDDSDGEGGKAAKSSAEDPPASNAGDLPEDNEDEPDILDINEADWDFGFSPLAYATLFASLAMVDLLLESGADVDKATSTNHNDAKQLHPLDITILRDNEDEACTIAERLIKGGASSSKADEQLYTIFHDITASGKLKLAATVLRCDPNAKAVIDIPAIKYSDVIFPVVTAVQKLDYGMVALLIAHGAKLSLAEEDITKAMESRDPKHRSNLFGYGVKTYIDQAFTPLETAINLHNDIAQLLLTCGADYNLAIKYAKRYYSSVGDRRTLKDWVDRGIRYMEEKIENAINEFAEKPKINDLEAEPEVVLVGWKEHVRNIRLKIKGEVKEPPKVDENAEAWRKYNHTKKVLGLKNIKAYLLDMQRLLTARNAKSWPELFPDLETNLVFIPSNPSASYGPPSTADEDINSEYIYLTNNYRNTYVPTSLSKRYDELYEACFKGDDDKIKELCLAAESGETPNTQLLNINVQIGDRKNIYTTTGWTPLFAACTGSHWKTAKLIVAISASQYSLNDDDDDNKVTFRNISLDDDSDDGSEESYESDDTIGQKKEMQFVDIAKVSSTVKSDVHPSKLIKGCTFSFRIGDQLEIGCLLDEAIHLKDAERFKNIAALYQGLSPPVDLGPYLLDTILRVDSPEILDEYIRISGYGLDFEAAKKATAHLPPIVNDENRVYLGLNVHGKKRADLAQKNDPSSWGHTNAWATPIVWKAAQAGSLNIIQYLATDKPLAAYKHHATAFSDIRAEQLRRTPDLDSVISSWLGWNISTLGESPLTAATNGLSLPAIKTLFSTMPQFMKTTLHQTIKFVGYNAFLLAIEKEAKPELLDYLLAKSISPVVHDTTRGWNVLHNICNNGNLKLLRYLRDKLPKDVFQELLRRQSKGRLNTPLHVAVKKGRIDLVNLILEFDNTTALYRNIDGQTPLHYAIAEGYSEIAKELLQTPQHGGLYTEDSIGQTPFELAALKEFLVRLNRSHRAGISNLAVDSPTEYNNRINADELAKQIPRLTEVVQEMVAGGIPANPQKYAFDMNAFIKTLESNRDQWLKQLQSFMPAEPEKKPSPVDDEPNRNDYQNIEGTWKVIEEALTSASVGAQRELIKLLDVQQSVKANLDSVAKDQVSPDDDSDAEEDPEVVEWNQSIIHHFVNKGPDTL
ncbi:ankyrin repeat protein [Ephemerocybe angulata]|uniref:Ankyrin repeat protein n=1 Tax=Ephemerocybe angulata TaxID=980116 RepID=A0A8H6HAQ8_9AGAR|nr:ankyrin repeat protein [Tulosesus angulatus]